VILYPPPEWNQRQNLITCRGPRGSQLAHARKVWSKFRRSWVILRTDGQTKTHTVTHGWSQYLLRLNTERRRWILNQAPTSLTFIA